MTLLGAWHALPAAINISVQHKRSTRSNTRTRTSIHINPVFHLDDNTRPVAIAATTVPAAAANQSEREPATELLRR